MTAPLDPDLAAMPCDAASRVVHVKLALFGAGVGLRHLIDQRLRRHALPHQPPASIPPEWVRQRLCGQRAHAALAMRADRADREELAGDRDAESAGRITRDDGPGHADVLRIIEA